jgi:hypothetical protein
VETHIKYFKICYIFVNSILLITIFFCIYLIIYIILKLLIIIYDVIDDVTGRTTSTGTTPFSSSLPGPVFKTMVNINVAISS